MEMFFKTAEYAKRLFLLKSWKYTTLTTTLLGLRDERRTYQRYERETIDRIPRFRWKQTPSSADLFWELEDIFLGTTAQGRVLVHKGRFTTQLP